MEALNNHGKIIVIEGLDGSGKATQSKILLDTLSKKYKARRLSFPDYESDSSAPVRMYLKGEFGSDPSCVNAYAAATFYAVDRIASYLRDWKEDYSQGTLFVLDRYTTSNMVYMTSKLPRDKWDDFLMWLEELEYERMGLPRPDSVIYLDMPTAVSQKLMSERYQSDDSKKDLHEKNVDFLNACRESALYAADKFGWTVISCNDGDSPRSLESIARDVMAAAEDVLGDAE